MTRYNALEEARKKPKEAFKKPETERPLLPSFVTFIIGSFLAKSKETFPLNVTGAKKFIASAY